MAETYVRFRGTNMAETYVRFRGTNASVETLDIGLGDRVEFTASGECVAIGIEKRADGEERPVVTVKVDEVDLGDVTEAPKDDQLPFSDAPDDEL